MAFSSIILYVSVFEKSECSSSVNTSHFAVVSVLQMIYHFCIYVLCVYTPSQKPQVLLLIRINLMSFPVLPRTGNRICACPVSHTVHNSVYTILDCRVACYASYTNTETLNSQMLYTGTAVWLAYILHATCTLA